MKIAYFTHSLESCWNHGNAHFLRGVLRELAALGHRIAIFEPADSWSRANLIADHGDAAIGRFQTAYPELTSERYDTVEAVADRVADADLVLVHEWNDAALVAALGRRRARGAGYRLLFHDTHHRAVSAPAEMRAYDLDAYDGVLAFGETLAAIYRGWGWDGRVWVWHEAADTRRFHPPGQEGPREGLVWIGNWGDGERTEELETFLFRPAAEAALTLDVHGVRYPPEALATLARHGVRYRGWIANADAPAAFARHRATVHVPRRQYTRLLPGIPTIRVFEALACGIPLVSAPWDDCEGLFAVGEDFLMAEDGAAMTRHLRAVAHDDALRDALVASGLARIRSRHSCAHRAQELLAVHASLGQPARRSAA